MFGWMEDRGDAAPGTGGPGAATSDILITGHAGLVSGMGVATDRGWRRVDALRVGDRVLTFDHGPQALVDIQRESFQPAGRAAGDAVCPIRVPNGALNNAADIWLMPDQGLMVESDTVLDVMDDPFALIPARALGGFRGIRPELPEGALQITTLAFRDDEVIYVEGGLLAHCPRPRCILTDGALTGRYRTLDSRAARYLVDCLREDNDIAALVCDPEEIAGIAARGERLLSLAGQD